MMSDTLRPTDPGNVDQHSTASAIVHNDPACARDRGFGLALLLLSALSTVTGVVIAAVVGWRGGLAMFLAATLVLSLFLRWEMRRRTQHHQAILGTPAQADLIITETSPL